MCPTNEPTTMSFYRHMMNKDFIFNRLRQKLGGAWNTSCFCSYSFHFTVANIVVCRHLVANSGITLKKSGGGTKSCFHWTTGTVLLATVEENSWSAGNSLLALDSDRCLSVKHAGVRGSLFQHFQTPFFMDFRPTMKVMVSCSSEMPGGANGTFVWIITKYNHDQKNSWESEKPFSILSW